MTFLKKCAIIMHIRSRRFIMSPWILDILLFIILLLGLIFGSWRGFVKGICKLAGTIFAIIVSVSFCNPFKNALENWFGMTTAIAAGVGEMAASVIALVLSFLILFILVKSGALILGLIGNAVAKSCKFFDVINRLFGAVLGLIEAIFLIYLLLTICYWVGSESLNHFISQSTVVSAIYRSDWFIWAANFKYFSLIQ